MRTDPAHTFRVCVYCGSSAGRDPAFAALADSVGACIAANGGGLVYGGSSVGLMGVLADRVLAEGAEVIGVMPSHLDSLERSHGRLTRLEVVDTMHARKARMIELSTVLLALPGGIGTLDELFEAWTWSCIGLHGRPVALLNAQGYWDPVLAFVERASREGFLAPAAAERLTILDSVDALGVWLRANLPQE